ncbi:MAG: hypothetical protein AAB875_02560, partial [Patescibacteria group bacterium]
MIKQNFFIIALSVLAVIFGIAAYYHSTDSLDSLMFSEGSLGAFPSQVSSGDTITSADWNALVKTASSTNPYDVSFTGHLTITSASSTDQTINNLWGTKLSSLTSNGFVKTSGSDGTLSVDTSTYTASTFFSGTTPITYRSSDGNISIATSSASVSGFLTTTDWNTFNNKQATITGAIT